MSLETMEFLNGGNILADGSVIMPWWVNQKMIDYMVHSGEIAKSPIYDGPIPLEDVQLLFSEVITGYIMAAMKELGADEPPTLFYADGTPFSYRPVIAPGRQLIGPAERDVFFMAASDGYDHLNHQFGDVLLTATEAILGDELGIITAGRLRDGAQGFVSVGIGDTFKMDTEGVEFAMYLTAASSFDGKVATQWVKDAHLAVCDNTMRMVLANGARNGMVARVKHTRHSSLGIADARQALELIEVSADEFAQDVATLCATPVSGKEWSAILDSLVPIPVDDQGSQVAGRGLTMATTKRDTLNTLYSSDERVSPWNGNAFGVLQAFNTYGQHEAIVRGANRVERNLENAISGKIATQDALVLSTIAKVCERELVMA